MFIRVLHVLTSMNASFGVVFFQAEDGIRYLVRSRGLGDVYKRQNITSATKMMKMFIAPRKIIINSLNKNTTSL